MAPGPCADGVRVGREVPPTLKPIGFVLRKSAHEAYTGLSLIALGSLAAAAVSLPLVTIPGALAGCLALARALARGEGAHLRAFFHGFARYGLRATLFGALAAALAYIPLSGWLFWHQVRTVAASAFFFTQLGLYLLFCLASTYTLPLLVLDDCGPMAAFARSARLFLDHPGYTLGIWLQLGALAVIAAVATVAVPTLLPMLGALVLINATENLRG